MNKYAIIAIVLISWTVCAVLYGGHLVQVKWNLETARREAIAEQERIRNSKSNEAIEAKHKKDIEHAKSQAGRIAIYYWLKSHGMLPDGTSMPGSGDGQTNCTGKPDGTTGEPGTGEHIEEFAQGCALDALHVLRWQEWAVREGLEVK